MWIFIHENLIAPLVEEQRRNGFVKISHHLFFFSMWKKAPLLFLDICLGGSAGTVLKGRDGNVRVFCFIFYLALKTQPATNHWTGPRIFLCTVQLCRTKRVSASQHCLLSSWNKNQPDVRSDPHRNNWLLLQRIRLHLVMSRCCEGKKHATCTTRYPNTGQSRVSLELLTLLHESGQSLYVFLFFDG